MPVAGTIRWRMDAQADMPKKGGGTGRVTGETRCPFQRWKYSQAGLLGAEANADEFYQAGLACAAGVGSDIDLISAHKWFNLAASKGHDEAKLQRQEMADMLSTDEVKVALSAARDWLSLAN